MAGVQAGNAGTLSIQLLADVARLQQDLDKAKRAVGAASGDIAKNARAANDNLAGIGKGAGTASTGMQSLASRVKEAGSAFSGFAAVAGVIGIGAIASEVIRTNAEFQSLSASLKIATGSLAGAGAAMDQLRAFAAETPYGLQQSVEAFIKLKNLGLTPSIDAMRAYGNTASSMGKDLMQMVEAVADAATGEFERLKEFGIKASKEGDKVKFTFAGVTTSVQNSGAEIEKYLQNLGNTKFAGAMAEQMGTLNGQWSNLMDNLDALYVAIGQAGANNAATLMLKALGGAVEFATDNLNGIVTVLGAAAIAYGTYAAATAIAAVETAGLSMRMGYLTAAMLANPAVWLAAAVAGIALAFKSVYDAGQEAEATLIANAAAAKELGFTLSAASQAALKASQENGNLGASASASEPKIWSFKNAADGLTDSLWKQAKAARAARVEMLQQKLTEAQERQKSATNLTGQGVNDNAAKFREALGKGDLLAAVAPGWDAIAGHFKNLASSGRTAQEASRNIVDLNQAIAGYSKQIAGLKGTRIGKDDLGAGAVAAATTAHNGAAGATRRHTAAQRDHNKELAKTIDFEKLLQQNSVKDTAELLANNQADSWAKFNEELTNVVDGKFDQKMIDDAAATRRAAEEADAYTDSIRDLIGQLDRVGKLGKGLGALLGIATGNTSDLRGPLGDLLNIGMSGKDENGEKIASTIGQELSKAFKTTGAVGKAITGTLKNAGMGMAAGSLLGKQSGTQQAGSAIGGAAGGELGKMAAKPIADAIGGSMGKMLGEFAGPLGAIAGGVLGNVLGGLFKKAKWGRVDLTSAGVSGASGNSGSSEKAALASGNSIMSGLKDLATQLGGTIGDFGSIAVGIRNDKYRVNTSGTSLKVKKGAVDFGDDAEAAVAYAMKEAIEKGALTGIRASTNNLLKAGDDLQAQLQKALNFEGVFSELKEITDPIGAALDSVNKEFDQLRVVFKEAGASAAEYASLEQLLTIKRNEALDKERDALDDVRSRIAEAQGDDATVKAIARAKELKDALNDNVRAELKKLYAVEDATSATTGLTDAQTEAAAKAEQLREAWASIGADLMDEVNRIRGLTGPGGAADFATLQSQFNAAAGSARGGDQAAAAKLADLSQSLIEAAQNVARSRQEVDRVKAETAATLEDVARRAGAPLPQPALPSGSSQAEDVTTEMRDARDEVAAMHKETMAALVAISGNTSATTNILRNVTPDGNAIVFSGRAA